MSSKKPDKSQPGLEKKMETLRVEEDAQQPQGTGGSKQKSASKIPVRVGPL